MKLPDDIDIVLTSCKYDADALEGSVRQQTVHASVPQTTHIVTVPATEGNQILNDEYIISPDTAMFDTRLDLSSMTVQPFLNNILHTGDPRLTAKESFQTVRNHFFKTPNYLFQCWVRALP